MEAANEAARRAVNEILKRSGSTAKPCKIWDMEMPEIFAPFRAYDQIRYDLGLPWDEDWWLRHKQQTLDQLDLPSS
jgi:hypothetical protein